MDQGSGDGGGIAVDVSSDATNLVGLSRVLVSLNHVQAISNSAGSFVFVEGRSLYPLGRGHWNGPTLCTRVVVLRTDQPVHVPSCSNE